MVVPAPVAVMMANLFSKTLLDKVRLAQISLFGYESTLVGERNPQDTIDQVTWAAQLLDP